MFIITFLILIFILKTVYEEEKKAIVFMYLKSKQTQTDIWET